jgi:hypothetical protein
MASLDLIERDPNGINEHVKVSQKVNTQNLPFCLNFNDESVSAIPVETEFHEIL